MMFFCFFLKKPIKIFFFFTSFFEIIKKAGSAKAKESAPARKRTSEGARQRGSASARERFSEGAPWAMITYLLFALFALCSLPCI
jgi:F0F1-type ATP synthase assembly protein I